MSFPAAPALRTLLSTGLALGATLAFGCSTAELEPDVFELEPDAAPEAAADIGCAVTIERPPSELDPVFDLIVYDDRGRLVEMRREFGDGAVSERTWEWSEEPGGAQRAERDWFDGSRAAVFDGDGRLHSAMTYDDSGSMTWLEELSYDGPVMVKKLTTRVSDDTPWLEVDYDYDGDRLIRQERRSLVGDPEPYVISYDYQYATDGEKVVESHDEDADGVVDFKTAVVIADTGLVERGVDRQLQLIDYEYQGPLCEQVTRNWVVGDPFFIDL